MFYRGFVYQVRCVSYSIVFIYHTVKPPVSHLTFLEFLSGRNHLTEEEIQEMQLNAYQIRSGLSSTNAEKFDEFLA